MGSLAAADMTSADATGLDIVLLKEEQFEDGYSSSSVSTPEAGVDQGDVSQDVAPIQKRKGGRKPVSVFMLFALSYRARSTTQP